MIFKLGRYASLFAINFRAQSVNKFWLKFNDIIVPRWSIIFYKKRSVMLFRDSFKDFILVSFGSPVIISYSIFSDIFAFVMSIYYGFAPLLVFINF